MPRRDYWVNAITGQVRAGYMTHAELRRELATARGVRRDELVKDAQSRMKSRDYPRFPASLGIRPAD
jgi:hypothetical protein